MKTGCDGKSRFSTINEAANHVKFMKIARNTKAPHIYHCKHCGNFHTATKSFQPSGSKNKAYKRKEKKEVWWK